MIALPKSPDEMLSPSQRAGNLRSNLRCSVADGGAWGIMVGMGESYLPAFALAAGLGEVTAGWVASLPMLAGGILQTVSLRAIPWVGSYQRWVALSAAIQACAFFPLVLFAWSGGISAAMLFFLASVYWAGGLAAGPAWNTWIGHLVPKTIRSRFFACRSRINQLSTLSGFLIGGAVLHYCRENDKVLMGFGVLFFFAGIARLISVTMLAMHCGRGDGTEAETHSTSASPSMDLARGYRLMLFLVIVQGMVQFSGPYFTPYLLKQLDYSYAAYVALLSTSFIARACSLSLWGHVARNHGPRKLLWTGALGIVPLAAMWLVSNNFYWLVFTQALTGCAWAAYELGFFLMFFEALPPERRTRMLTMYNLANSTAWFTGSLLGGWCLSMWGANPAAYLTLFMISSVGRCGALVLLWNVDHPIGQTLLAMKRRMQRMFASVDATPVPAIASHASAETAAKETLSGSPVLPKPALPVAASIATLSIFVHAAHAADGESSSDAVTGESHLSHESSPDVGDSALQLA